MTPLPLDHTVRRADVLWRRSGGSIMVRIPGHDEVVVLADTGVALWQRLSDPVRVHQLCDELAAAHDADLETVRGDVAVALDDLIDRDLVVFE